MCTPEKHFSLRACRSRLSGGKAQSGAHLSQKRGTQLKAASLFFEYLLHSREVEHDADHRGDSDKDDRVQVLGLFDVAREDEQHQRKDDAAPADRAVPREFHQDGIRLRRARDPGDHLKHHARAGRADQAGGGGTKAVERVGDILAVAEFGEHRRNDQNDDDRRRHLADGGDDRARHAADRIADIGRHVDADRTRRRFRHSQHVHQVRLRKPARGRPDILKERQRRHAAADGKQARFEKFPV